MIELPAVMLPHLISKAPSYPSTAFVIHGLDLRRVRLTWRELTSKERQNGTGRDFYGRYNQKLVGAVADDDGPELGLDFQEIDLDEWLRQNRIGDETGWNLDKWMKMTPIGSLHFIENHGWRVKCDGETWAVLGLVYPKISPRALREMALDELEALANAEELSAMNRMDNVEAMRGELTRRATTEIGQVASRVESDDRL